MTREQWLLGGVELLRPRLPDLPPLKVSVGWPKGGRKVKGQCWSPKQAKDGATYHIFVSPEVDEPTTALAILLHELVHAAVGLEAKHGTPFRRAAGKAGLVKPWTGAVPGVALGVELAEMVKELGEYPHVQLTQKEKQKTRLKLWECACEPPVKIRRAGDLNARCLDCGQLFEKRGGEE